MMTDRAGDEQQPSAFAVKLPGGLASLASAVVPAAAVNDWMPGDGGVLAAVGVAAFQTVAAVWPDHTDTSISNAWLSWPDGGALTAAVACQAAGCTWALWGVGGQLGAALATAQGITSLAAWALLRWSPSARMARAARLAREADELDRAARGRERNADGRQRKAAKAEEAARTAKADALAAVAELAAARDAEAARLLDGDLVAVAPELAARPELNERGSAAYAVLSADPSMSKAEFLRRMTARGHGMRKAVANDLHAVTSAMIMGDVASNAGARTQVRGHERA